MRAGCDVGIKDKDGHPGRGIAAEPGPQAAAVDQLRTVVADLPEEIFRILLRRADQLFVVESFDETNRATLHRGQMLDAARGGDDAAVMRLLAAGADPNALVAARTASGKLLHAAALCEAAHFGHLEAARMLLDGGADPNLLDSEGGSRGTAGRGGKGVFDRPPPEHHSSCLLPYIMYGFYGTINLAVTYMYRLYHIQRR